MKTIIAISTVVIGISAFAAGNQVAQSTNPQAPAVTPPILQGQVQATKINLFIRGEAIQMQEARIDEAEAQLKQEKEMMKRMKKQKNVQEERLKRLEDYIN